MPCFSHTQHAGAGQAMYIHAYINRQIAHISVVSAFIKQHHLVESHHIPPHRFISSKASSKNNSMRGPNDAASTTTSKSGGASMAAFKQDLLRNLLLGLRARPFDAMSLRERKRAVKCSADVAMAAARRHGGRARWPKAILAAASSSSSHSLRGGTCNKVRKSVCKCKRVARWRVAAKRIRGAAYAAAASGGGAAAAASCGDVARRLVRRRTMALRKVIPGGNAAAMDEAALLRETMDYVVHLRAQVDVLRRVSAAVQISSSLRQDPSQAMGESS